ncbi:hypothetical protein FB45DRAFT_794405 [Roridomyces roridus]|uniref:Uncharacterized protein n=1 Tax=Roridomyces roridus TaxID=1738132 RepID=A0AAD7BRP8_9AGAR|nr:hypothetical protein FB45DRAFT_794405 [Roridomyces roridus]
MPSDSADDSHNLRRRIADLEEDLRRTQAAKEEVEIELSKAEYKHNSARNLAAYGRSDDIIFVPPGQHDGYIQKHSKGHGFEAKVFRFMVRYNVDQYLQRPRLHQWLNRGHLYREAGEQQPSRFELFFDLLFVGMVHQISEAAAELPTGLGFARYVLTFAPAFSIWVDVRDMANQFSNDDVTQRAYILWIMMLLVGYANNASAIRFGEDGADGLEEIITKESFTSMRWTLGFLALAKLSRVLLYAIYATFLPLSRKPLLVNSIPALVLAIIFFAAIFTSLHTTIALAALGILLDHGLRVVGVLLFKLFEGLGKKMEKRRLKQLPRLNSTAPSEAPSAPEEAEKTLVLAQARTANSSTTAVSEPSLPLENFKLCRQVASREDYRIPAINIEHLVERLGAFVTIMLGEIVVSVFFVATSPAGLGRESGRALLSLMLAFNYNWMYFDSPACRHFMHAIRRHWFTGFVWTTLHLPLCMSLLLASSAINRLVISESIGEEPGLRWYFGAGLGVSLWIMATLGVLHRNLDEEAELNPHKRKIKRLIGRRFALGTRYLAGVAMVLIPLVDDLSSLALLSIYVGITAFLIILETFASIERRDQEKNGLLGNGT